MKLKQLADISTGYSFRSRLKPDREGDTQVIQMSDVDKYRGIVTDKMVAIKHFDPRSDRYFLDPGDIIMTSKGYNLTAFVVPDMLGKVVAVNSFLVIKLSTNEVMPGYLAWYLNSKRTQHFFKAMAAGTNIPNLSKKALEELDIQFPSRNRQEKLARLDELKRQEIFLHREIARKKEKVIDSLLQLKADEWLKSNGDLS